MHIPRPVRCAILERVGAYGVRSEQLGPELLMREGFGSFDDLIAAIGTRYGTDEADRVIHEMDALALKDLNALQLDGRRLKTEYLVKLARDNLARYALIALPDAEFLNGLEVALDMVGDS